MDDKKAGEDRTIRQEEDRTGQKQRKTDRRRDTGREDREKIIDRQTLDETVMQEAPGGIMHRVNSYK